MSTRILIDNSLEDGAVSYLFENALDEVRADTPDEVDAALTALSEARDRGLWAAGFFSYELGYLMEPRLAPLLPGERSAPLLRFALFSERQELTRSQTAERLEEWRGDGYSVGTPQPGLDRATYANIFERVKAYISAGDIYQLNLTLKAAFSMQGCPVALYRDLRRKQPVAYGALMQFQDMCVLSHSPELYLEIADEKVATRPMKGTAGRAMTLDEDRKMRQWLAADEKSRAENLMIVDLMRNDLSRIAQPGSVKVTDLFSVETYKTLHQMTSGVEARLNSGADLRGILQAIFPSGSITGAPKLRAMEIIRELEAGPRGIYTGAVGMLSPNGDARFNVAIRTLVVDNEGHGEIGIGSGVVADSDANAEYDECLLKMRFLTDPVRQFELIETLRYDAQTGYYLLDRHLERLRASAAYFDYPCDIAKVRSALQTEVENCSEDMLRVRLLLGPEGEVTVTSVPMVLSGPETPMRYIFSDQVADSSNVFLYHKTTIRDLYDGEHARAAAQSGADEVLFVNERGELTEGSRTNIFIERDGVLLTPPISSGLLAGTLRAELLASGKAEEAVLTRDDLAGAALYLGNSVRGLLPAKAISKATAHAGS